MKHGSTQLCYPVPAYFNPRTPCGVRRCWSYFYSYVCRFQSTHPLRGATNKPIKNLRFTKISIHAPLAGCDKQANKKLAVYKNFNPRTPCGVRRERPLCDGHHIDFNPRTPCGVRPYSSAPIVNFCIFQSTHPLRGATPPAAAVCPDHAISIHAPLAGCDRDEIVYSGAGWSFQSTHPLRGATKRGEALIRGVTISIHAPLAGCDSAI